MSKPRGMMNSKYSLELAITAEQCIHDGNPQVAIAYALLALYYRDK